MNSKNREMSELEKKIYSDIQSRIYEYYCSQGIEYRGDKAPEDTIINFLSYLFRLIPVCKRKVHYSKELSEKIDSSEIPKEYIDILKIFDKAFVDGKDMNGFLSNNTKKIQEVDFLLYTWHLYHLHMSNKFAEDRKQMKNNRSDLQLLCIIKENDVYFVDIIFHPQKAEEYFNIKTLKIIADNGWMEKIGFSENRDIIPCTFQPRITDNKDIFDIYSKASANIGFEFYGKVYVTLEPITSNRKPHRVSEAMIKLNRAIRKMNCISGLYIGFEFYNSDKGYLLGLAEFKTQEGDTIYYNIWE